MYLKLLLNETLGVSYYGSLRTVIEFDPPRQLDDKNEEPPDLID